MSQWPWPGKVPFGYSMQEWRNEGMWLSYAQFGPLLCNTVRIYAFLKLRINTDLTVFRRENIYFYNVLMFKHDFL